MIFSEFVFLLAHTLRNSGLFKNAAAAIEKDIKENHLLGDSVRFNGKEVREPASYSDIERRFGISRLDNNVVEKLIKSAFTDDFEADNSLSKTYQIVVHCFIYGSIEIFTNIYT